MDKRLTVWNKVKFKYVWTNQKIWAIWEIVSVIQIDSKDSETCYNYGLLINNTDIKMHIHPGSIIEIVSKTKKPSQIPKLKKDTLSIWDKVIKDKVDWEITWTYRLVEIGKGERYFDEALYQFNWSWFFYPANNYQKWETLTQQTGAQE